MAKKKGAFSSEEDAVIKQFVKEAEDAGSEPSTAYPKIAEQLNREEKSVENRHKRITGVNTKKQLSEGERLALRLKEIVRENARADEKTEKWKERFEEERKEHNALKREYNVLRNEYENLLRTVRHALGEPEEVAASKE